jgi:hypothetical protein
MRAAQGFTDAAASSATSGTETLAVAVADRIPDTGCGI